MKFSQAAPAAYPYRSAGFGYRSLIMDNARLAGVERQNALLQIDLEWERERQGLLFRGVEPTPLQFLSPIVVASIGFLVILALVFYAGMNSAFW